MNQATIQDPQDDPLRRIRWQCRRGLLELDVLLGDFLEKHYCQLREPQQAEFVQLLQHTDQQLLYWFTEQAQPPAELAQLIHAIKYQTIR